MKEKNYYVGNTLVIMPPLTPEEKQELFTAIDSGSMTIMRRPADRPQPSEKKEQPPE